MENATEARKRKLIRVIMDDNDTDAFRRNMGRVRELESLCDGDTTTIDMILDELFSRRTEGRLNFFSIGSPVWHLLEIVEALALPPHAVRVAEILSWDELVQGQNRSDRALVPEILKRIGDRSVIPALEAFAEKVKGIEYDYHYHIERVTPATDLNDMDQKCIEQAINACQTR